MCRERRTGLHLERHEREDEAGGPLRGSLQDQILGSHEVSRLCISTWEGGGTFFAVPRAEPNSVGFIVRGSLQVQIGKWQL